MFPTPKMSQWGYREKGYRRGSRGKIGNIFSWEEGSTKDSRVSSSCRRGQSEGKLPWIYVKDRTDRESKKVIFKNITSWSERKLRHGKVTHDIPIGSEKTGETQKRRWLLRKRWKRGHLGTKIKSEGSHAEHEKNRGQMPRSGGGWSTTLVGQGLIKNLERLERGKHSVGRQSKRSKVCIIGGHKVQSRSQEKEKTKVSERT